ncbi:MAG: alpha-ketoglutarate-dependent dioxygenase AlkB, partial [Myxococcota bacterium]
MVQPLSLFTEPPRLRSLEPERTTLGPGSWVDRRRGWVAGPDTLFGELVEAHTWHASRRKMYDRVVDVPRLFASVPDDGPGHPLVHA